MDGAQMPTRILRATLALVFLFGLTLPGIAQTYPDRVVRIVNPFPPGGSVDVMARLLAQKLTEELGQQFIVETRAGAGGNTGARVGAQHGAPRHKPPCS